MKTSNEGPRKRKFNTRNMKRFVDQLEIKGFSDAFKNSVKLSNDNDIDKSGNQYLCIEKPAVLAAFFAFCSGPTPDKQVYLRGCTRDYQNVFPSLFRPSERNEELCTCACEIRWNAYKYALENIRTKLSNESRWERANVGAILQHYGVNTPWLDVIRNLYTAIWFATHEFHRGPPNSYKPSRCQFGWISFYRRIRDPNTHDLKLIDLSGEHSSMFVRAHVQHGMSIAMQDDNVGAPVPLDSQDFNYYRIANVRFPITDEWKSCGALFSPDFMFPSKDLDSSLRRLVECNIDQILCNACCIFGLPDDLLGSIASYEAKV